jgi:polysaccharide biosynthesis/export protein
MHIDLIRTFSMNIILNRISVICLAAICGYVSLSQAQTTDTQQPTNGNATAQQISSLPVGSDMGRDNRVFSPSRIFSKPSSSGVNYDLKDRPAPKPGAPAILNTIVETKVENKTTHVGGGLDSGSQPDAAKSPPSATSPTFQFDFANLVRQSTGTALPLFGTSLMGGVDHSNKTSALDPLTIPSDYRVGPGDELLIRAWGQIDIDYQGAIDRSGSIFLPRIGSIMVSGQKLADLRSHLQTAIGKQYKGFELTVSLGALRQIQYYVTGFAKQTGVHTTESTATALHGILSAGGALPEGDLRRIELRRADAPVIFIDAYDFLASGNRQQDPQLLPGDVLHIPPAQGFVAVAGNVRRSAIYHLAKGMRVADLLQLAGGVALGQGQAVIRRERLRPPTPGASVGRLVDTLSDDAQSLSQLVQDGDLLMVLPVSPRFEQAVTLRGNVSEPLRQPYAEGMRISDLLSLSRSFVRPATWADRQSRTTLDGFSRSGKDNDLNIEFPDVNWNYAAIERFDPIEQAMRLVPFNLGRAIRRDPEHDLVMRPGDTVVIFAKSDFRQPEVEVQRLVRIEGEVKAPGLYPIKPGETLREFIVRAGGLTDRAYIFGTNLARMQARKAEATMLKEAADRIEQDYFRYLSGRARNSIGQEEASVGYPELEAIKTLVQRLRTAEPEGRIALDLKNEKAQLDNLPELALEDQDKITIPSRPSTVSVLGAVFRQGSLLWQPSNSARYYVENSGGLRKYADTSGFVVFRADGTVRQVSNSWFSSRLDNLNPGDTILVPEDVHSSSWTRVFRDWSQIFYQLGLGTAALKILRSSL